MAIRGIRQTIPSGYYIGRSSPGSSKGEPQLLPIPPTNQQAIIAGSGGKATQGGGSTAGGGVATAATTVTAGTGITVSGAYPAYTVSLQVPVTVADGGTNASSAGTALDNIGPFSSNGILSRTGAGTYTVLTDPLPVGHGGTNATSASGTALDNITGFSGTGYLKRTGAGTYSFVSDGTSHQVLHGGGTFSQVDLTADVTGVLPAGNGGAATVGQIPGTATNDNAGAGKVGEYISSIILGGSAVNLSNGVGANVTSISLTAGDWDVWGEVWLSIAAGTTVTQSIVDVNTASASGPSTPADGTSRAVFATISGSLSSNLSWALPIAPCRASLSGTTNYYLNTNTTFSGSTCGAYGKICARRVR